MASISSPSSSLHDVDRPLPPVSELAASRSLGRQGALIKHAGVEGVAPWPARHDKWIAALLDPHAAPAPTPAADVVPVAIGVLLGAMDIAQAVVPLVVLKQRYDTDGSLSLHGVGCTLAALLGMTLLSRVAQMLGSHALMAQAKAPSPSNRVPAQPPLRSSPPPAPNTLTWLAQKNPHVIPVVLSSLDPRDIANLAKVDWAHRAEFGRDLPHFETAPGTQAGARLVLARQAVSPELLRWVDAQPLVVNMKGGTVLLRQGAALLCSGLAEVRERCLHRLLESTAPQNHPVDTALSFLEGLGDTWGLVEKQSTGEATLEASPALASALLSPYRDVRAAARGLALRLCIHRPEAGPRVLPLANASEAEFHRGTWTSPTPPPPMTRALEKALGHWDAEVRKDAAGSLLRFAWSRDTGHSLVETLGRLPLRTSDPPAWKDLMKEVARTFHRQAKLGPDAPHHDGAASLHKQVHALANTPATTTTQAKASHAA